MFDVGFSEMMVIAVVALVVIGPERLPKVARTLGHLFGRLQRYVNDVKADINREMELEELRKFKDQFQDTAQSLERTIYDETKQSEAQMQEIGASVTEAGTVESSQSLTEVTADSATLVQQADTLSQSPVEYEPGVASKTAA